MKTKFIRSRPMNAKRVGPTREISLNRPANGNALTLAISTLEEIGVQLGTDREIRAWCDKGGARTIFFCNRRRY